MKRLATVSTLVTLVVLTMATIGEAATLTAACNAVHAVRNNPAIGVSEVFLTNIVVRNDNASDPATIQRITIHDAFGNVVYDGGPAIGAPLRLNTDFNPPMDVTVIPPNTSVYLSTKHIWGNNPLPEGNQNGFSMTFRIQYSTTGRLLLVSASSTLAVRQRVITPSGPADGEEHSRARGECRPVF